MRAALFSATLGTFMILGLPTVTTAAEPADALNTYLEANVLPWADAPVIVEAVSAQNAVTSGYDQSQIDALDRTWREEVGTGASALVDGVLMGPAADFLREHVSALGGTMTEVIVMDSQGLNVAASNATSDYWQGDEDKYQKTYGVGVGAVHFSEIEFDESTQIYQVQISFTLTDPATGAAIGAMTVGLDAESLM